MTVHGKNINPHFISFSKYFSRSNYYSETSLFSVSLRLLDAILRDSTHVTTDVHVERFFIFCFTFVLRSVLTPDEQKRYSDLLKNLISVLPDDDREISVFPFSEGKGYSLDKYR